MVNSNYLSSFVQRLAQHILDQRTDLERFFMDALDHVRGEIQKEREAAKKAAQAEYNRRMRAVSIFVGESIILQGISDQLLDIDTGE